MSKAKPCQGCVNLRADLNRRQVGASKDRARIVELEQGKAAAEYAAQRLSVRVESLLYALNLSYLHAKGIQDDLAGLRARREFDKRDSVALAD